MISIEAAELERLLQHRLLISALRNMFRQGCEMPARHHHDIAVSEKPDATLLLMPAWQRDGYLGVKSVTVYPGNAAHGVPTIMGFYVLMNARTGEPLAWMDAPVLTALRTASASALAAEYLAREDARRIVMIGTGALAPHLIRAHAEVRPITHVAIFGRSPMKAARLASTFQGHRFEAEPVSDLPAAVESADIVCCATTATEPVLRADWLRPGTHVDLVGAFKPHMREADDDTVARASVYVDSRAGAAREAGDLLIPLRNGTIDEGHISGDLFELCRGEIAGRTHPGEVTLFKSVGMGLEDLAAAQLAYRLLTAT